MWNRSADAAPCWTTCCAKQPRCAFLSRLASASESDLASMPSAARSALPDRRSRPDPEGYPAGQSVRRSRPARALGLRGGQSRLGGGGRGLRLVDGLPLALEMSAAWIDTTQRRRNRRRTAARPRPAEQRPGRPAGSPPQQSARSGTAPGSDCPRRNRMSFPGCASFRAASPAPRPKPCPGVTLPELAELDRSLSDHPTTRTTAAIAFTNCCGSMGWSSWAPRPGCRGDSATVISRAFVQWVTQAEPALHGPEQPASAGPVRL